MTRNDRFLIFCGQKSVTPGVQLRIAPTTRITNRCWWGKATEDSPPSAVLPRRTGRGPGLLRPRNRSRSEVEIGPKPVHDRFVSHLGGLPIFTDFDRQTVYWRSARQSVFRWAVAESNAPPNPSPLSLGRTAGLWPAYTFEPQARR